MQSYSLSMPNKSQIDVKKRLNRHGYVVKQEGDTYVAKDPTGNVVYF